MLCGYYEAPPSTKWVTVETQQCHSNSYQQENNSTQVLTRDVKRDEEKEHEAKQAWKHGKNRWHFTAQDENEDFFFRCSFPKSAEKKPQRKNVTKWNYPLQHQCYGEVVLPPRRGIKSNVWAGEPDRKPQSVSPPPQLKPGLFCLFRGRGRDSIDRRALESELTKWQKQTQYSCARTLSHTHAAAKRALFQTEQAHNDLPSVSRRRVWRAEAWGAQRQNETVWFLRGAGSRGESTNSPFESIRTLFCRVYVQRVIYMVGIL